MSFRTEVPVASLGTMNDMTPPRALRIDDLRALPVLSDPQLSPDGRLAAYVVTTVDVDNDTNASAIWWVPTDGSAPPRQVTAGPLDVSPRWSPDGRRMAFVATRGEQSAQLFVLPVDGGEAHQLGELSGGVSDPQWSPDGRHIALTALTRLSEPASQPHAPSVLDRLEYKEDGAGLTGDRRSHVFVLDVASGETTQVTAGDFSVSGVRWSPDANTLAYAAAVGVDRDLATTSAVFLVPATGGEPAAVTPLTSRLGAPTWFPDGQQLLVCGQERLKSGHQSLYVVPRIGGIPKPVAEIDRNVMLGTPGYPGGQPVVLADGRVLMMVRDAGCTHLYGAGPDTAPACLVGGTERSLSGLSVAAGVIAYLVSDCETNGELCVAALDGTGERRLTRHFADALPGVALPEPQPREFLLVDGTTIHGWVLRAPETAGASPLLLDVHGGPHGAWGPAFDGTHLYHQELVNRGWTVLLLNPRGSDGYGEEFYATVSGSWGLLDEGDFLTPVDALIDEGLVDARKVVVTGYSYGGYMSCWLSARHPERWAAAIPGGVATDLATMAGTADISGYLVSVEFGGVPWEIPEQLRASSPLSYVQKVTTPTLLLQAQQDERCPVSQAELWFAALRMRQVPVTLVLYPEADHQFILNGRPSHRQDWCTRIVEFAVQHAG